MKSSLLVTICILSMFYGVAQADSASSAAVAHGKSVLVNSASRQEVIQKDAAAKAADDRVQSLTSSDPAQSQEIYNISAEAMDSLMKKAGNDPDKAMEVLQKAAANPEAFYKDLSPEVKAKIRSVSSNIERSGAGKKQP